MESQLLLEVVGDLSHESLEGELSDQELGRLLVLSDLTEGNCSWSEFVGLLHTTGGGG